MILDKGVFRMKRLNMVCTLFLLLLIGAVSVLAQGTDDDSLGGAASDDKTDTNDAVEASETADADDIGDGAETEAEADETEVEESKASNEEIAAVEAEALDEKTEKEVEVMREGGLGPKMRVLQLKRALLRHLVEGKAIVAYLAEKDKDVSGLQELVDELQALVDEVSALNPQSETAVEDFVNVKRDARELVKQFREEVRSLLVKSDREALRIRIQKAMDESAELEALRKEIIQVRRDFNAQRVEKTLERLGRVDPALLERVKSGEGTRVEVRETLKKHYQALNPEQRKAVRMNVGEKLRAHREWKKDVREKVVEKHIEVRKERLQRRLETVPEARRAFAEKRIAQKLGRLQRVENGQKGFVKDVKALRKEAKDLNKDMRKANRAVVKQNRQGAEGDEQ